MIYDKETFFITVGSETPIQLYPTFSYKEEAIRNSSFDRTQAGQLNAYSIVGSSEQYMFPLDMINSEQANIITSWWLSNAKVDISFNNSESFILDNNCYGVLGESYNPLGEKITSRIVNKIEPFQKVKGRYTDFEGVLTILTGAE